MLKQMNTSRCVVNILTRSRKVVRTACFGTVNSDRREVSAFDLPANRVTMTGSERLADP